MASVNDWCEEKISKLSNEENRIPILKEVKDYLIAIPREEITRTANGLELPPVFDCLNDSDIEQVDLACEVLTLCMNNLTLGESTNKYGVFLERALNHPFAGVKLMALNEITRNIESEDILIELCKKESLLISIIKCASDVELTVAKQALEIIKRVGLSNNGIKRLFSGNVLQNIHEVMELNEIVRFRIYETLIELSVHSEDNFNLLKSSKYMTQILNELDNNDVLLRLNIIELLSKLVVTKYGYEYLDMNHDLKKILLMLEGDDSITIQLCEPGILKFFGHMAHWKPIEILVKYPSFFERIVSNLESNDYAVFGVSVDILGHIGLTNEGKVALDSIGIFVENAIKNLSRKLPIMPTEIKERGLNCFANLFTVSEMNNKILTITQKWFLLVDASPIEFFWNYARNPFAEIRLGGFAVLHSVANQSWGQEIIKNTPGMLEFLLDRSVETIKECKEVKYGIVELLSQNETFDRTTNKRLQTFVNEGPFYVRTVTEVAIDGNE